MDSNDRNNQMEIANKFASAMMSFVDMDLDYFKYLRNRDRFYIGTRQGVIPAPVEEKPKPKPPPVKLPDPPSDTREVDIPFTDVTMPLPSNEILVTAGTTATVSVAATLTATAVFKWTVNVIKPILKQAWTKITKRKGSSNSSSLSGPPDS